MIYSEVKRDTKVLYKGVVTTIILDTVIEFEGINYACIDFDRGRWVNINRLEIIKSRWKSKKELRNGI